MNRRHQLVAIALPVLLIAGSGCAGFGGTGDEAFTSTAADESVSTTPPSTATTAPTTAPTTTAHTTSTAVLTDRTPSTRLELHLKPGFTDRIRVALNGIEVYNETFTDYAGFNNTDLSDEFHDDAGYEVYVIVSTENDTYVWRSHVGETEGYELDVLQNGTVRVRSHIIS